MLLSLGSHALRSPVLGKQQHPQEASPWTVRLIQGSGRGHILSSKMSVVTFCISRPLLTGDTHDSVA